METVSVRRWLRRSVSGREKVAGLLEVLVLVVQREVWGMVSEI